jgi:cytochrome P450
LFCDILDVSRDYVPRILAWGDSIMVALGTMRLPEDQLMDRIRDAAEFDAWVRALINERRGDTSRDDFLSALVNASGEDADEELLSDEELRSIMALMVVAGHETTRHLIANAIYLLIQNPEQLEEIKEKPELAENAVEETLRHSGSVKGLFRVTTKDAELNGVRIPAGDRVFVMFGSANWDEDKWADPERFDIHREGLKDHLAFGKWEHFCIGAPLARSQGVIAIREVVRRMPNLRVVDEDPPMMVSMTTNGRTSMNVAWDVP